MNAQIDNSLMKHLEQEMKNENVIQALADSISPETLKIITASALTFLLKPTYQSYYGSNQSPLQHAFNEALKAAVKERAVEFMKSPEVQLEITKCIGEVGSKIFNEKQEVFITSIADAFVTALDRE